MATKHFFGGRVIHGTEFVGYKYKFFEPGTSTQKTTYKDSALTAGNENAHPVVLDANGAAQIWFDGNADVVFYTSADVVVYSDDDINVSTTSSTSGSGNLLNNSSFETDSDADGIPDNWTRTLYTAGTFSLQTTDQFNGQKSIKFTSVGTGGGYITSTDTFAVSPSVAYTIGWAMKGTADVRNVVEVLWYQDDGSASGVTASTTVYDDSTTNPTSWTEKWYEATSPSDAAFAKVRLTGCHSSDATSGNTAYDSVVFTDLAHKRSPNTITGVLSMSGKALNLAKGASIAAAGTMNIWGTDGNLIHLTGTGTVRSFGTATQAGARRTVIADGTVIIAHDGTRIVTEGTSNITTSPDDRFEIIADTTTKHYVDYIRALGYPNHKVVVHTGNGHGSTNTKIRRFTTVLSSVGTAITRSDTAADGTYFTINEAGLYVCSYYDKNTGSASDIGITLNSGELTTNIGSQTSAGAVLGSVQAPLNGYGGVTVAFIGAPTDIIRAHTDGTPNDTTLFSRLSIHKISGL